MNRSSCPYGDSFQSEGVCEERRKGTVEDLRGGEVHPDFRSPIHFSLLGNVHLHTVATTRY